MIIGQQSEIDHPENPGNSAGSRRRWADLWPPEALAAILLMVNALQCAEKWRRYR
jgi:hypothetical protein